MGSPAMEVASGEPQVTHPLESRANLFLLCLLLASCKSTPAEPLRVAAASDLSDAFTQLGAQFEKDTGTRVVFSFGSSGLLAKQLSEGAPFDLFAAASERFAGDTTRAGACDAPSMRRLARGRLAAWSAEQPVPSLTALAEPRFKRVALANPEHAPYGRAAQEALQRSGTWDALASRLVTAENVRQALQLARTGNAEAALVAYANVINLREGTYLLVDAALHAPLEQVLVRCQRGAQPEAARRFVEYLDTVGARAVLKSYGFEQP